MELTARREAVAWAPRRRGFLIRLALAAALVALADYLFFFQRFGSTLGLYALALTAALLLASPAVRRSRPAMAAAAAAGLFALALADDPSLLAWTLFWTAAASAALLPRAGFDDAVRWAGRLLLHGVMSPMAPIVDLSRLLQARRRRGPTRLAARLAVMMLPLAGTIVFVSLFAAANPLIADAFARIDLLFLLGGISFGRILFWAVLTIVVWALVRPRLFPFGPRAARTAGAALPGVSLASVTLSLLAFNALFALQNGLDLAFLWSGAPLPAGTTLAEYAHRGAYPLIATALLAGLFVLVTLRPGSDTAGSARVRRLVYAWIGQNVLLVASTALRTLDYVEAYSLTRLRISALLWMALVAVGLVLICWRLARGKSGAWLINANLAAAAVVLAGCSAVDLGTLAARWNVRHARDVGGRGGALDLCYLNWLGDSSLVPLAELESRPLPPALRERVGWLRNQKMDRLETVQADWHGWTWRNHRRLSEAKRQVATHGLPRFSAGRRLCDGRPMPPEPLTPAAGR